MLHRILFLILVSLTIYFFIFVAQENITQAPKITNSYFPTIEHNSHAAKNEFLILLENNYKHELKNILENFNLHIIKPLDEWVLVGRENIIENQKIISLSSYSAQENYNFINKLEAHPAIHTAYLNYILKPEDSLTSCQFNINNTNKNNFIIPEDPLFEYQWHLSSKLGININNAWNITTGNPNTLIAIVDRYFFFDQQDLIPERCKSREFYYENIWDYFRPNNFYPEEDSRHGTHVLSVLGSCTNNSLGISGIDWRAQIFAIDTKSDRTLSARMLGILWAAGIDVCSTGYAKCPKNNRSQKNQHPANIINTSFGFSGNFLEDPPYGPILDIIGRVNRQGQIIVASAGNEGIMADRRLPGSAGGVISVGSSNKKQQSSYFNNFGRTIDILAPGEEILGFDKNKHIYLNGTSFSAPIISGIVSLMLSVNPNISWKHAEYILKKTARPLSCTNYCPSNMNSVQQKRCKNYCCKQNQAKCASGIVDAEQAVLLAQNNNFALPLLDLEDYFIPLNLEQSYKHELVIKNWGQAPAQVRQIKTDPNLKIYPETFTVPPANNIGQPGSVPIQIIYDNFPEEAFTLSLVLQSQTQDRIEAIVEISPDHVAKNKYLRDLPPINP